MLYFFSVLYLSFHNGMDFILCFILSLVLNFSPLFFLLCVILSVSLLIIVQCLPGKGNSYPTPLSNSSVFARKREAVTPPPSVIVQYLPGKGKQLPHPP